MSCFFHHIFITSVVFRQQGLLVVSDEIYSRLSFQDNHVTLAKVNVQLFALKCK